MNNRYVHEKNLCWDIKLFQFLKYLTEYYSLNEEIQNQTINNDKTNDDSIFLTDCSYYDSQRFCISNFASIRAKNKSENVRYSKHNCYISKINLHENYLLPYYQISLYKTHMYKIIFIKKITPKMKVYTKSIDHGYQDIILC